VENERHLVLMSLGDFCLFRLEPMSIFGNTIEALKEADFLFVNQEAPISDRGTPNPVSVEAGMIPIRAPLRSLEALTGIGTHAVTLANNHGMDYGEKALRDTLEMLEASGIAVTGAGTDHASAHQPALIIRGDTRVAMLGYTSVFPGGALAGPAQPGMAGIRVATAYEPSRGANYQPGTPPTIATFPALDDVREMEMDIRRAREVADLVVIQFHWGVAGFAEALGYMKELGRTAIDAGADLVIGNHQHVLAGVEIYKGVPIYYGLNHFAFDSTWRLPASWPGRDEALILRSEISQGRFVRHTIVPVKIRAATQDLCVCPVDELPRFIDELAELSREYGTCFDLDDGKIVVSGPAPGTPPPRRSPEVLFDKPLVVSQVSKAVEKMQADAYKPD
jgi:poly-gamma-glutamate capsule biosynthesis protein CapA/YwtB (metallophosphatase superfamily)